MNWTRILGEIDPGSVIAEASYRRIIGKSQLTHQTGSPGSAKGCGGGLAGTLCRPALPHLLTDFAPPLRLCVCAMKFLAVPCFINR